MRIALVHRSLVRAGGTETYLAWVVRQLLRERHQVAFLHEVHGPPWERLTLPAGMPVWCASDGGVGHALEALRGWGPRRAICA